jgi:hypothetical protein
MQLVRVYSFTEGLPPAVQKAVEIAESIGNDEPSEYIQAILLEIPDSQESFTFVKDDNGQGAEIMILCPLV